MRVRRTTATSNFGVGRRESHDASAFYDRFRPPDLSADDTVPDAGAGRRAVRPRRRPAHGRRRRRLGRPRRHVAAVLRRQAVRGGARARRRAVVVPRVPELLTDVFAECVRTLEPGGRIAVNVANLGRKPYRSLSADVIRILEHDLGLLLRGELIWQKAEGANGSCAWGSYRSAANPVLRDITERVIVASKGRFDRARTAKQRAAEGLPHASTLLTDDFLALTLDVWSIPPESARRVGHPAPFPVELPEQLIRLYTFADDLVLDPFMGSGSTLVAAARLGRRYVGYDLDAAYVDIARRRVDEALAAPSSAASSPRQASPDGSAAASSPNGRSPRPASRSRPADRRMPRHRRRGRPRGHRRRRGDLAVRRGRGVHQPPRRAAADGDGVAVARPSERPARPLRPTCRWCC